MICFKAVQGRHNEVSKKILPIGTGVTYIKKNQTENGKRQPYQGRRYEYAAHLQKKIADFPPFFSPIEKSSTDGCNKPIAK
jgi:hypothetical protein